MIDENIIIRATLKGTNMSVAFMLTPIQYQHYQFVKRKSVPTSRESVLLNQVMAAEMKALAGHFDET